MIKAVPCKLDMTAWGASLVTCRIHGNVEMGEHATQVLELDPENAAGYVLLLNIDTSVGNRHLCGNVEQQRKERGVKKQPGCTWIKVNNEVHTFVVEDQDHPQIIEIQAELKRLSVLMHDAVYMPCSKFILHDVMKKKRLFICVTIARNWLLHRGSSTQLLVLLSK